MLFCKSVGLFYFHVLFFLHWLKLTLLLRNAGTVFRLVATVKLNSYRPGASSIYLCEIKRFDPFKFSIYAWCVKIANAGSLTPVRLAWVPFLRVLKIGFIYVEADTKKLYAGL